MRRERRGDRARETKFEYKGRGEIVVCYDVYYSFGNIVKNVGRGDDGRKVYRADDKILMKF